jgi:hypothetical protein
VVGFKMDSNKQAVIPNEISQMLGRETQREVKSQESKKGRSQSKKPLVIYISENDHTDMSYGSVMEQIIKNCLKRELTTQTFSEFESQSQKVEWMKGSLKNEASSESFQQTTAFLDTQFLAMLPLTEKRFPIEYAILESQLGRGLALELEKKVARESTTQQVLEKWPEGIKPMDVFTELKGNIDNPEISQLLNDHTQHWITDDGENGKKALLNLRNCLSYKAVHEAMAHFIKNNLESQTDVAIVVAGSQHIPGIDQELGLLGAFKDNKKIIVGNTPDNLDTLRQTLQREGVKTEAGRNALAKIFNHSGAPELCENIGEHVSFKVNSISKEASIPNAVKDEIAERSNKDTEKKVPQEESK